MEDVPRLFRDLTYVTHPQHLFVNEEGQADVRYGDSFLLDE